MNLGQYISEEEKILYLELLLNSAIFAMGITIAAWFLHKAFRG